MPCDPFETEGGKVTGWICSPARVKVLPQRCYVCGRPATKFCDYRGMRVTYQTDDYGNKMRKVLVPDIMTCDRPMCDEHALHREPDTDFCEFHADWKLQTRSAQAEKMFREQCERLGIEYV